MSILNSKIIPFKTIAFHNNNFINISEDNLKGNWSIFFFYPADFTFICPTELGDLADNYIEFKQLNIEIYSISTDTHFTHKAWYDNSKTISKIKFPMLGDPTGKISRNFNVMIEEEGIAERATFIIDHELKIKFIEINDGNIGRNAKYILRNVKAIQYVDKNPGEVCPANWLNGKPTLIPSINMVGKI
ncbi:peroxiredoxin [Candidatus Johnevansia muelleri]|uniref:Alkyl hydroperoxide reductase C n=1 Tax=Candidatus Johnevansia muelleri TaxID=1495769 RepID=A0A078KAU2_9GAMM|nr:peroxiredoxin [Candidatus Evansia muelleri]